MGFRLVLARGDLAARLGTAAKGLKSCSLRMGVQAKQLKLQPSGSVLLQPPGIRGKDGHVWPFLRTVPRSSVVRLP